MDGIWWVLGTSVFFSTYTDGWPLSMSSRGPGLLGDGDSPCLGGDTAGPEPVLPTPTGTTSTLGE